MALCLAGCTAPDAVTVALVHQSVPNRGWGPEPIGDHDLREESVLDGAQVGLWWESGRAFAEVDMTYALNEHHLQGGPWFFQARAGAKIALK